MSVAVFGYASLVSAESAAVTIGRPVEPRLARLQGWKRRWSQARDNNRAEKTFALADGTIPDFCLALNVEPGEDPAGPVNGVLIELSDDELDRLDIREIRYHRVEVTDLVEAEGPMPDRVITYSAKPANFAPEPAPGTVIIDNYATLVERAFKAISAEELSHYLASTGPCPVDRVEAMLVSDRGPEGNPKAW